MWSEEALKGSIEEALKDNEEAIWGEEELLKNRRDAQEGGGVAW